MKKMSLLTVIIILTAVTSFAQTGNLGAFDLILRPDNTNFQALIANENLLSGAKFTKGQTYELEVTFTVSRDCRDLNFALIDNTEAARWWRNLSNWPSLSDVKAGQTYNEKVTFVLDHDATSASIEANKVVVQTAGGRGNVTVRFSKFILTRK